MTKLCLDQLLFSDLTLAESFFDGPWHSLTSGRASQTSLRASKACVARPLFGERTTFYPPYKKNTTRNFTAALRSVFFSRRLVCIESVFLKTSM